MSFQFQHSVSNVRVNFIHIFHGINNLTTSKKSKFKNNTQKSRGSILRGRCSKGTDRVKLHVEAFERLSRRLKRDRRGGEGRGGEGREGTYSTAKQVLSPPPPPTSRLPGFFRSQTEMFGCLRKELEGRGVLTSDCLTRKREFHINAILYRVNMKRHVPFFTTCPNWLT